MQITSKVVADPGEGGSPLFLDQTEAWRAEKIFGDSYITENYDDHTDTLPPCTPKSLDPSENCHLHVQDQPH